MQPFDPQRTTSADPGKSIETGPPAWLLALERAQAAAHRAARALENAPASDRDFGPAARALEIAIEAALSAIDLRRERLTAVHAAMTAIDESALAVGPAEDDEVLMEMLAALGEARAALSVADERLSRMPIEEAPAASDLRANQGIPWLHAVARPTLVPHIRVAPPVPSPPPRPPPIAVPRNLAELEEAMAEVERRAAKRREGRTPREASIPTDRPITLPPESPPGFAAIVAPAISELEFLHARTRDCFEEVAMIGSQRAPLLGDPWRTSTVLERRMLAAIDAIAAMGSAAIARVEPLVLDSPAKDPSRGFAATMVLGSIAGRDSLAAAERIARHLGVSDPEALSQFGAALKLVAHSEIGILLRTLLVDPDPLVRALAIDVLGYRGIATDLELGQAATDASPAVVAAALPWLAATRPGDAAIVAEPLLDHGDVSLREAAWIALGLAGHPRGAAALVRELAGPDADRAAIHLGIFGDEQDAARLLARAEQAPSRPLLTAVGWAGSAAAVPVLISLLQHEDEAVQLAAAYALDRITGARLYEEKTMPPEDVMVPDVDEPDVGEAPALAREVSDPRDEPSAGADDVVTIPTTRVARWTAYWSQRGADYRPNARYRRGHPYTPLVSLWELDAWPVTPSERRLLQRELVVRTGQFVRFDPHDFVSVQEEALKQWEPIAKRSSGAGGSFSRPMRR